MGSAAKDILKRAGDAVQRASDDILVPVMQHFDRKSGMTPEERQKARADDPKFKEQDDKYQDYVKAYDKRKAEEK